TSDNRWLGYGFGTFNLPRFDYLFPIYRVGHAHSSFLQAYFETGLAGVAALFTLVGCQISSAWRYSVRCNTFSYSLFLVLYTAVSSLTGLNYAGQLSMLFSVMILFLAIETRESLDRNATSTIW